MARRRPPRPAPSLGRMAPRRRPPLLPALLAGAVVLAGALVAGAFLLSRSHLKPDPVALGRLTTGPLAGHVESVRAYSQDGRAIPVSVAHGRLTPSPGLVAPGERVSVEVVVRRPGALSWLLGARRRERLVVTAPVAHVTGSHLVVAPGSPVRVAFDQPVRTVAIDGRARRLARPERTVSFAETASAGSVPVAAAPRAWERLGGAQLVTWFPPSRTGAAIATPPAGALLTPTTPLRLTFSRPVAQVLAGALPGVPAGVSGRWARRGPYTLLFTPGGAGAPLGARLTVALPRPVALVSAGGTTRTVSQVTWTVRPGSTVRLHQLLAQAGYLPVTWTPAGTDVPHTLRAEVRAAVQPPAGHFSWRYPNTPAPLRAMWQDARANDITRGAVVAFENAHGLTADGFAGPHVWSALLRDAIAQRRTGAGYSYVYVHRDSSPQTLTLWHDGRTVVTSPANTGIASAPTELGTYPVFEHLRVTTMSGTNPDGSHYSDPGIQYVSYFHGGDAVHAFDRASFGTPQSLGCVELPLADAARVWPYMPIGTLVTIEH